MDPQFRSQTTHGEVKPRLAQVSLTQAMSYLAKDFYANASCRTAPEARLSPSDGATEPLKIVITPIISPSSRFQKVYNDERRFNKEPGSTETRPSFACYL